MVHIETQLHTGLTLPLPWSASVPAHFSAVEAIPVALDKTSGLPYCYKSIDIHNTYVQMTVFALREYNLALLTDTYVRTHTHACAGTDMQKERERETNTYQEIRMYVSTYTYVHTTHTCIQYDVCMYVRTYVHAYEHTPGYIYSIDFSLIFLFHSTEDFFQLPNLSHILCTYVCM